MYEIEKDIPIPSKKKYPFKEMDIGDSFLVTCDDSLSARKKQSSILASLKNNYKHLNKKFITRINGNTVRVWRIR